MIAKKIIRLHFRLIKLENGKPNICRISNLRGGRLTLLIYIQLYNQLLLAVADYPFRIPKNFTVVVQL